MMHNDVVFNGAGDTNLPSVEQAWSILHLDPRYRSQNCKTIDGIASIMREFDDVVLEVHGETGPADHAPQSLSHYFGIG